MLTVRPRLDCQPIRCCRKALLAAASRPFRIERTDKTSDWRPAPASKADRYQLSRFPSSCREGDSSDPKERALVLARTRLPGETLSCADEA